MAGRFRPAMIIGVQTRRGMHHITPAEGVDLRAFFAEFSATGASLFNADTDQGKVELEIRREQSTEFVLRPDPAGEEEGSVQSDFTLTSRLNGEKEVSVKAQIKYDSHNKPSGVGFPGSRLDGPGAIMLHPATGGPLDQGDLNRFGKITTSDLLDDLISLLQILDDRVKDVRAVPEADGSIAVKIKLEGISSLQPIGTLGGGVSSLIRVFVSMAYAKGGWMSWDEIENGLHYAVQPIIFDRVIVAAKQMNVQLMMSTHSGEALSAVAKAAAKTAEDDFAVINLVKGSDRAVKAVVVHERDALAALATGHELR